MCQLDWRLAPRPVLRRGSWRTAFAARQVPDTRRSRDRAGARSGDSMRSRNGEAERRQGRQALWEGRGEKGRAGSHLNPPRGSSPGRRASSEGAPRPGRGSGARPRAGAAVPCRQQRLRPPPAEPPPASRRSPARPSAAGPRRSAAAAAPAPRPPPRPSSRRSRPPAARARRPPPWPPSLAFRAQTGSEGRGARAWPRHRADCSSWECGGHLTSVRARSAPAQRLPRPAAGRTPPRAARAPPRAALRLREGPGRRWAGRGAATCLREPGRCGALGRRLTLPLVAHRRRSYLDFLYVPFSDLRILSALTAFYTYTFLYMTNIYFPWKSSYE